MKHLNFSNVREKCSWLALVASALILTSTIALTLLGPSESQALDQANAASSPFFSGDYQSPQNCRECHAEQFQAWSGTTHADASFDPIFQVYLERVGEPGECLSCHTTGYNSFTGQFVLAGVTCEACHGPYRPEHPEESMQVAASEELCGTCHTRTHAEWVSSHHSAAGVSCADCHEVHTQKTRSSDVANALCAGCHQDQTKDAIHEIHVQSETGIHCTACHLARPDNDASDMVKGQIATGHSFVVAVSTCDDCHPSPVDSDIELP
jgi:hypothetical protein